MNSKAPQWWSVPQAIVWIVGRDLAVAERARTVGDIDALETWEEMPAQPATPPTGEPPISQAAALGELLRAAIVGRIEIRGHYKGTDESRPVPVQSLRAPRLRDYHPYGPVVADGFWSHSPGDFWANLWIKADKCMKRWPGAARSAPVVTNWVGRSAPPAFVSWAKRQQRAGIIVTYGSAVEAMKHALPTSPGRATLRAWIKDLPDAQRAKRGTPPPKR